MAHRCVGANRPTTVENAIMSEAAAIIGALLVALATEGHLIGEGVAVWSVINLVRMIVLHTKNQDRMIDLLTEIRDRLRDRQWLYAC